jgi:hypothetical protein
VDGPLPGGNDRSQPTAGHKQHNTRPGVWSRLATCRLPDFFPSPALDLSRLTRLWCALAFRRIHPGILCANGRAVPVGDGLKVASAGRKMPGVRKLHQQSESSSKPEFIFGHSCQAVAVLTQALASVFALTPGLPHPRRHRVF